MKSNKKYEFKSVEEAVEVGCRAIKAGDKEMMVAALGYSLCQVSPEDAREIALTVLKDASYQGVVDLLNSLIGCGWDSSDNACLRAFYETCMFHFFDNAPPDVMATLREGFRRFFPDLRPIGYDEDGNPLYTSTLKLTQVCSLKADPHAVAEIGCS